MGPIFNFTEVVERWLLHIVSIVIRYDYRLVGGGGSIILDDVEWYIDESDIS